MTMYPKRRPTWSGWADLEVLRQSQLVHTRDAGRQRVNSLNAVPIRQISERWVGPFQELWSGELLQIKEIAEKPRAGARREATRRRKKTSGYHRRPAT
jgi:hypothetical protein